MVATSRQITAESASNAAARVWPQNPTILEISAWVWLSDLRKKHQRVLDLSSVPAAEWDAIAEYGFDAVWLMGVWERSPAGITIANRNDALLDDFRRVLPDFSFKDNVGSPYCVRRYVVDRNFGGPQALAVAREELAKRGVRLILDFVPNHVAPDHPWVIEHPEYFIQPAFNDARNGAASHIEVRGTLFACGRDPYFPPWPDVLQLNAFRPDLRHAVAETISAVARQCDGVRCDMAMLVLNSVFERTWGGCAGERPASEYWVDVITAVKKTHPSLLFIAEAYWDLEWELQQQGFDFCYDKRLYDRLKHDNAESVRLHLCAGLDYQKKLLRFIENHDEPRAAAAFPAAKELTAALTMATLPGARMFHEGQFEGRKIRPTVFLGRRPDEVPNPELQEFYKKLLATISSPTFYDGQWSLCERSGWPDNLSFQSLVAWSWVKNPHKVLIVVNLSNCQVQARVQLPWSDLRGKTWTLSDLLSGANYLRDGDEMSSLGLYVELEPWGRHCFRCCQSSVNKPEPRTA